MSSAQSTSQSLSADPDALATLGNNLQNELAEAHALLAATYRGARETTPAVRGPASTAWAALLEDWAAQAQQHKAQGSQLADGLTSAAQAYRNTDQAAAALLAQPSWLAGWLAGQQEDATKFGGHATSAEIQSEVQNDAADLVKYFWSPLDPTGEFAQERAAAVQNPLLTEAGIDFEAGKLSALEGHKVTAAEAMGQMAQYFPADGKAQLSAGQTLSTPTATQTPRSAGDLLAEPWLGSSTSPTDLNNPDISVRKITDGGGKASYVVNIAGQRIWELPGDMSQTSNINDPGTSFRAIAGQDTAYQQAVQQAMVTAGVKPTDPVTLVGSSQGGIIAAEAAADWVRSGAFNVTNVITMESPIAQVDMPRSVQVLAVQGSNDSIPYLSGRPNPTAPNWTTVTYQYQAGDIMGNHVGPGFPALADIVDGSTDPKVQAFARSLAANGFTTGTSSETTAFAATRVTS